MPKIIDEIFADLISLDPEFAKIEPEIRALAAKMISAKPDCAIDSEFKNYLKNELLARIDEMKNVPPKSSFNFFPMQKLFFALGGAAVAIAVFVGVQNFDRIFAPTPDSFESKNFVVFDSDGEPKIVATGERAFGSLAGESVDLASSTMAGKGGGGGIAPGVDTIIAPTDFEIYKYIYDEPIRFSLDEVAVLRRVKNSESSTNLARSLAQFDFDLVDLGALRDLEIQNFNLVENREYGYSVAVDLANGSISVNQNWEKWPDPYRDCIDSSCYENLRLQKSDMLTESEIIAIADELVRKFGVDLANYGAPEIQNNWKRELARFEGDESDFYFPESVSVVFPFEIDGKTVFTSGGTPDGITVTVNQRFGRAIGIYGLSSQNYESSNYAAVTDENLFRKFLERGGVSGGYFSEGGKIVEVALGEPEEVLLRHWNYSDGENEELILPAMRFPIVSDNPNIYQAAVVVPLVAEILEQQNSAPPPMLLEEGILEIQKVEADAEQNNSEPDDSEKK